MNRAMDAVELTASPRRAQQSDQTFLNGVRCKAVQNQKSVLGIHEIWKNVIFDRLQALYGKDVNAFLAAHEAIEFIVQNGNRNPKEPVDSGLPPWIVSAMDCLSNEQQWKFSYEGFQIDVYHHITEYFCNISPIISSNMYQAYIEAAKLCFVGEGEASVKVTVSQDSISAQELSLTMVSPVGSWTSCNSKSNSSSQDSFKSAFSDYPELGNSFDRSLNGSNSFSAVVPPPVAQIPRDVSDCSSQKQYSSASESDESEALIEQPLEVNQLKAAVEVPSTPAMCHMLCSNSRVMNSMTSPDEPLNITIANNLDHEHRACKIMQLLLLMLSPAQRKRLEVLVTFMKTLIDQPSLKLDDELPVTCMVIQKLTPAIFKGHPEKTRPEDTAVFYEIITIMMNNSSMILHIPEDLHLEVHERIQELLSKTRAPAPRKNYFRQQMVKTQERVMQEKILHELLEYVVKDTKMSAREKSHQIMMLRETCPNVYYKNFEAYQRVEASKGFHII